MNISCASYRSTINPSKLTMPGYTRRNLFCSTMARISVLATVLALPLSLCSAQSTDNQTNRNIANTRLQDDYIYGYAPVALQATRAIQTAVPDNTKPGQAPINQFSYQRALSTPDSSLIVRPNADTLYSTAWLDLASEPVILHVPETNGRYYLIPMLDAYSNEFASIGSRTTGTGEGNYAIVGPFWQGSLPPEINGVIHAPTNTVWIIGRTLVNGPADLQNARDVVTQYLLIPQSAYSEFLQTGSYTPPVNIPVTPPDPDFLAFPATTSQGFSEPKFFDMLAQYSVQNPPSQNFLQASGFVLDGFLRQNELTADVVQAANSAMDQDILTTGKNENGWSFHLDTGNYGTNYLHRAAVAKFGLGANAPADAIYMSTFEDISGTNLAGTNSYVIHFDPGQTPPERGFWSITVYDQNGLLVPNPIQRYNVGSQTRLVPNADGSLDIFLQTSQPPTQQSNWLPIPAGSFNLTLRIFWPDQTVLDGTWVPPTLSATNAPLP